MRIARTRGAASGTLLILLGLWGGLIPFIGPYFDFVIGTDDAWDWTAGRFWLSLLPAIAVVCGAMVLTFSANRVTAGFGAWLALLGGAWFVVGQPVSELWNDGVSQAGTALGDTGQRVAEQLAYFYGLGALIVALAAFALGRLAVRSVGDARLQEKQEAGHGEPYFGPLSTRFGDRPAPEQPTPAEADDERFDRPGPESTSAAADRVAATSTESRRSRFLRRTRGGRR